MLLQNSSEKDFNDEKTVYASFHIQIMFICDQNPLTINIQLAVA